MADGAVAIGECGLDYHYDTAPRDSQRATLSSRSFALAAELDRPIVLHTRDAEADTIAMLAEAARAGVRGVLHCFTGSRRWRRRRSQTAGCVSFSGIVTFKRWTDDALLRLVPDDRLLVESDAPYLAPVPHRGKRNEPAWVSHTVARVATARGATAERIGALALANTRRFFGLASADSDDAPAR